MAESKNTSISGIPGHILAGMFNGITRAISEQITSALPEEITIKTFYQHFLVQFLALISDLLIGSEGLFVQIS